MQTKNYIQLKANENKFLTDGKRFVKAINIGEGQSEDDWSEVDEIVYRLYRAKQSKIRENDIKRDTALLGGVEYQGVLFDSDTDQKINLLATVSRMSDTDTITWFGMDNQGLLCTKVDLLAIGQLITELHSFCWQNNAYIKEQIEQAETIAEVNAIEINYDRADT